MVAVRLLPPIGAWCWKLRANRPLRRRHLKNFAAPIGDQFLRFCDDKAFRPDEAEDITQGFFAELLERGSLDAVRKEKGRLRSFLLGGLKYFLANEGRRAMAIKREKDSGSFRWRNSVLTIGSTSNQRIQ